MAPEASEREDEIISQDWFAQADPWVEVKSEVSQFFEVILCAMLKNRNGQKHRSNVL